MLHQVGRLAQPGGVGQEHGIAAEVQLHLDHVSGGAGDRRNDRRLALDQAIEQARLARIGRADHRDLDALAQSLAAARILQMRIDLHEQRADGVIPVLFQLTRQVLIGKIDDGLALGQHAGQPIGPAAIELSERAIELAQRLAALHCGLGGDQVGEPFGCGEIELAIDHRPPGELAGLGRPQAGPASQRRQHAGDDRPPTMKLQLGHGLAGEAGRSGKPQDQPLIQQAAIERIPQPSQRRLARRRHAAGQTRERRGGRRAGEANHRNPGRPRAGGQREDRIAHR